MYGVQSDLGGLMESWKLKPNRKRMRTSGIGSKSLFTDQAGERWCAADDSIFAQAVRNKAAILHQSPPEHGSTALSY
jgi:hypothetical protein